MKTEHVQLSHEETILDNLWEGYTEWFKTEGGRIAQLDMKWNHNGDEVFIIRFFIPGKPTARYIGSQKFADFDEVMKTLKRRRYHNVKAA